MAGSHCVISFQFLFQKESNFLKRLLWYVCRHLKQFDDVPHSDLSTGGEQGWRSDESARLPPMCPRFDSRTRRHMWVEFVVGSRPCSEGVSPGSPVFLPPQKSTFLNSNSIGNSRATGLSVSDCYVLPSLNNLY